MIDWKKELLAERKVVAALVLVAIVVIWMFRFETVNNGFSHRNRITGAVCSIDRECWWPWRRFN